MNCLFYYLRYSLVGILPTPVIKHFEKLSVGTYILCKDKISKIEKKMACKMLKEYATEFETIYGPGAVTMNLHLLLHFENMIDNCGPLSAYNMFGFENKIMFLKSLVSGTTDVLSQIATKYPISISDENITHRNEKNMDSSNVNLYHNKTVSIKSEHRQILESTMSIEKDQDIYPFGHEPELIHKFSHHRMLSSQSL